MRVDDAGDDPVVDVPMLARDDLGCGHAFVFGFVCEHWPRDCVSDGVDAFDGGFPMGVCHDLPARGHIHPECFKPQPVGVGASTSRE